MTKPTSRRKVSTWCNGEFQWINKKKKFISHYRKAWKKFFSFLGLTFSVEFKAKYFNLSIQNFGNLCSSFLPTSSLVLQLTMHLTGELRIFDTLVLFVCLGWSIESSHIHSSNPHTCRKLNLSISGIWAFVSPTLAIFPSSVVLKPCMVSL